MCAGFSSLAVRYVPYWSASAKRSLGHPVNIKWVLFFSVVLPRVAQWWELSPPTNVGVVRILALTPFVGWFCCWFSPLLREVFLRVLRFSPLLKNQHFQIPESYGAAGNAGSILYWWRVTTQIWIMSRVNSIKFPRPFLRRHFAGKSVVASQNFGCFLRLLVKATEQYFYLVLLSQYYRWY